MSAATPAVAGDAMDVPAAQQYELVLVPEPRQGAITMSITQQSCATEPHGNRGCTHTWLAGSARSPLGAAKLTTWWPTSVYDAIRSRSVQPSAQHIGTVADTAMTPLDCAGTETSVPLMNDAS